jgi:hypothetical protein
LYKSSMTNMPADFTARTRPAGGLRRTKRPLVHVRPEFW